MKRILLAILLICLTTGCGSDDERLLKMAQDHEAQQAAQNQRMADLQKSIAEGSKRLVETEAESRDKLFTMQDNLRADQATVGEQRDKLEGERREIAQQRIRDPIIAAAIIQVGLCVACLLPLVLAGYLVHSMKHTASQDDAVVTELLVAELVSEHPLLLGPPKSPEPLQLPKPETAEPAAT
jgi:hypothetical protein